MPAGGHPRSSTSSSTPTTARPSRTRPSDAAAAMTADVPEEAQRHFQRAYEAQMRGRLEEAVEHYRRSIAIHPTAEAHTFLGWALSYLGQPEEAIAECKVAIALDPD